MCTPFTSFVLNNLYLSLSDFHCISATHNAIYVHKWIRFEKEKEGRNKKTESILKASASDALTEWFSLCPHYASFILSLLYPKFICSVPLLSGVNFGGHLWRHAKFIKFDSICSPPRVISAIFPHRITPYMVLSKKTWKKERQSGKSRDGDRGTRLSAVVFLALVEHFTLRVRVAYVCALLLALCGLRCYDVKRITFTVRCTLHVVVDRAKAARYRIIAVEPHHQLGYKCDRISKKV